MDLERGMVLHEGDGTTAAFRPLNWNIWRKLDPIPIIRLCQEEFRIWCRVTTASSPTGGVLSDPLGGRAAPRIPPAKTPLLAHPPTDRRGAISERRYHNSINNTLYRL